MKTSLAAFAFLLACPGPTTPAFAVDVGTGGTAFTSVQDNVLLLEQGCQGSQHIFTSLRIRGSSASRIAVRVTIFRAEDNLQVSRLDASYPVTRNEDGDVEVIGLTPMVSVPDDLVGREAIVVARVTDAGATAEASMRGVVQWGTPAVCN